MGPACKLVLWQDTQVSKVLKAFGIFLLFSEFRLRTWFIFFSKCKKILCLELTKIFFKQLKHIESIYLKVLGPWVYCWTQWKQRLANLKKTILNVVCRNASFLLVSPEAMAQGVCKRDKTHPPQICEFIIDGVITFWNLMSMWMQCHFVMSVIPLCMRFLGNRSVYLLRRSIHEN